MTHLTGHERAPYVQAMFTRIAARYDVMNRLMTMGQDARWRREVIRRASLPPYKSLVLDLGAGTGDLSFETLKQNPDSRAIAADFTLEMMKIGRERPTGRFALWSAVDALNIPFPDNTFDAVISGFLLRNVIDLPQALAEQYRVLKPGGRMISLDTTKPRPGPLAPLIAFHMHTIIPALGKLLTGEAEAYTYLPDTSENFLLAEDLAEKMRGAGFGEVAFQRRMFGVVAIHWGVK